MEIRKRSILGACVLLLAYAVGWNETVPAAMDPPAVAERKPPEPDSEVIRRYGSSAFRHSASQLAYSPDGRWLAVAEKQDVFLLDARTGEVRLKCPAKFGRSSSSTFWSQTAELAFSPDGRSLAIVDLQGLTIWEAKEGTVPRKSPEEKARISTYLKWCATSPDRQWRATLNDKEEEIGIAPWDQIAPVHKIAFKGYRPFLAVGNEGKWVAAADIRSPVITFWKAPKFDSPLEWKSSNLPIRSLATSPDGETLYAGLADGSVQAWNVREGREASLFSAPARRSLVSLAVSPAGTHLATVLRAPREQDLAIYEIATAKLLHTLPVNGPLHAVSLAFSPDGKSLALGALNRPIELWDVKTGDVTHRPLPSIENVFATRDRRQFGSYDQDTLSLWNSQTGQLEESFPLYPWPKEVFITRGDILFKGTEQLIIGRQDDTLIHRDLALGRQDFESFGRLINEAVLSRYNGHGIKVYYQGPGSFHLKRLSYFQKNQAPLPQGQVANVNVDLKAPLSQHLQMELSDDNQILAGAFADRSVLVWETQTGRQLHRFQCDQEPRRLFLNPNGRWLAVSFADSITLWNLKQGKQAHQIPTPKAESHRIAFGFQGKSLAVSIPDERIRLWSLETGKEISALPRADSRAESLAFSPDDKQLAVGYHDKTIGLFDLGAKREVQVFEGHSDHVTHLRFRADGKQLLSASKTPEVFVWDVATAKRLSAKKSLRHKVQQLYWSPDGDQVIVVGENHIYYHYPALEERPPSTAGGPQKSLFPKAFASSKEAGRVAVAYNLGIRTLDLKTGRELPFLRAEGVNCLEWSGDGRILMVASGDLSGWDVDRQEEVYRIPAKELGSNVTSIDISPDDRVAATTHMALYIRLWDPQTGKPIRKIALPYGIESLKFSPDGRLIYGFSQTSYVVPEVESGLVWFERRSIQAADTSFAILDHGTLLSAESQGTARLWSWAPPATNGKRRPLETLWESLSKNDGPTVCQSMFALADGNDETVEFLARRLPSDPVPAEKIASLVKDLENDSPDVRRKASEELRKLGSETRPQLEAALKSEKLSPRVRVRIRLLLSDQRTKAEPDLLAVRAVQLLEWIATSKARALIQEWAQKPTGRLGREAQAALDRLSASIP